MGAWTAWRDETLEGTICGAVSLDALEYDDYWAVIEAIDAAKDQDVNAFAAAIGSFGLVDMAVMAGQARRRCRA